MPFDWIDVKSYRAGFGKLLVILFLFVGWLNKIPRSLMQFFNDGFVVNCRLIELGRSQVDERCFKRYFCDNKYTAVCIFLRRFINVRESLIFL